MGPLSVLTYYRNNRKRSFAVFWAIFISVLLLYMIQMLADSSFYTAERTFVEPQKYYTSITLKGTLIDTEIIESIRGWDSVEKVIPWVFQYINFNCLLGGDTGSRVFTVYGSDINGLMDLLHVKLIEGRMPDPNSREIIVHRLLAKNKELSIGDTIGSHVEKDESLKGEYKIVGLIDGKSIVSFTGLEKWMEINEVYDPFPFGIIIIPKEDQMKDLNRRLEYLPLTDLELRNYELVRNKNLDNNRGFHLIINLINLAVIFIVSVCTGFLTYIYIYQRRAEFALLNAMGYTRRVVLTRSFGEIALLCSAAYVSGILMAIFSGAIIHWWFFYPKGQVIRLWDIQFIIKTSCVPVFAAFFSIISVWWLLAGLDPVSVLEGGMTDAD
ncbi:MAG: ABC transporter permease [Ruminiclostridium sp.]|nr:ABC transporter permease [Ruminiclostridium sp.]